MAKLVDKNGAPLSGSDFATARGRGRPARPRPKVGETNVAWGGDGLPQIAFKDGGRLLLDPSKLTLADYRRMKNHYQINSSLTVLTFMMHQLDWRIEGSNQKVVSGVEYAIEKVWTRLVRAMSTAFWAGYSPSALQWENDPRQNMLVIGKIKDLVPEYCEVAWKEVGAVKLDDSQGANTPRSRVYDGIKQYTGGFGGSAHHIPQSNSYWYPLLMENGDMGGKKLLDSAFAPWFFSNMIHAYANSYYERFGEPTPIGRAPYGEEVDLPDGEKMDSANFMAESMSLLRSGAAIILPNDKDRGFGNQTSTAKPDYEYDIDYLESQMRGADFEQHLQRLDEEMSLALFTPLLLLRTTQGSGYNVGVGHQQVYLWQLNALAADWKEYIDKYIIQPIVTYNYGSRDWATIKFRKMGVTQQETTRAIVQELIRNGSAGVDLEELGHSVGLTLEERQAIQEPDDEPSSNPQVDERIGRPERLRDDDQPSVDKPKTDRTGVSLSSAISEARNYTLDTLERGELHVVIPAGVTIALGKDNSNRLRHTLEGGLPDYSGDSSSAARFYDTAMDRALHA